MKRKTLMSWSSGKDSAWALHTLQQDSSIELTGLFCTVNKEFDRVAMHGVRVELLKLQAERIGLPLTIIEIPFPCSNEQYSEVMGQFVETAKRDQVQCFAFGDLFLEDIRRYREAQLVGSGIEPIFPLWGLATDVLARQMIDAGLRAVITCIDPKQTPENVAGEEFTAALLERLPASVDPCGENGEFHSFVFDGPMFQHRIDVQVGEVVTRDNFVFADVLSV